MVEDEVTVFLGVCLALFANLHGELINLPKWRGDLPFPVAIFYLHTEYGRRNIVVWCWCLQDRCDHGLLRQQCHTGLGETFIREPSGHSRDLTVRLSRLKLTMPLSSHVEQRSFLYNSCVVILTETYCLIPRRSMYLIFNPI